MIIKKFNAQSEMEAMLMAKEELGPDAIVMNVKTIKPRGIFALFKKPKVELTAAIDDVTDKKASTGAAKDVTGGKSSEFVKGFFQTKSEYTDTAQKLQKTQSPQRAQGSQNVQAVQNAQNTQNAIEEKINKLSELLEQQMSIKKVEEQIIKSHIEKAVDETPHTVVEENLEEDTARTKASENKVVELIKEQLINNEVMEKHANSILEEFASESENAPIDNILSKVYQKIVLKLGEIKALTEAEKKPKIVYFVGNTGVGKTTTMAKLASKYMLDEKKNIAMVSVDTYRIAAIDQIRTYANILSAPMEVVYSPEEMVNVVEKHKNCDFIFVDTAGRSHRNKEQKKDLQEIIDSVSGYEKEVFLVVSATVKYSDIKNIAKTYDDIFPYKIIFTKLDETKGWGNILNLKLDTGKDLSYVTWGQNVPDDIGTVNPQVIAKKLLGGAD